MNHKPRCWQSQLHLTIDQRGDENVDVHSDASCRTKTRIWPKTNPSGPPYVAVFSYRIHSKTTPRGVYQSCGSILGQVHLGSRQQTMCAPANADPASCVFVLPLITTPRVVCETRYCTQRLDCGGGGEYQLCVWNPCNPDPPPPVN